MNKKVKISLAFLMSLVVCLYSMTSAFVTAFGAEESGEDAFAVDKSELEFLYDFCQGQISDGDYFSPEFISEFAEAAAQAKAAADNYSEITPEEAEEAYWKLFKAYNDACLYNSLGGDVDGNGQVSVSDVTLLQKFTAKLNEMNCSQMYTLGSMSAEEISISDATDIQFAIANQTEIPVSEQYTELDANRDVRNIEVNAVFAKAHSEKAPEETVSNGIKIFLSPSNQDANTYSYGDTNEMIQCNKIAQAVEVYLLAHGFEVKRAPQGQDMYDTIDESNEWGADLHIPIHTNAFNYTVTGGTMVMVYDFKDPENTKAARCIYDSLAPVTPGPDQGVLTRTDLHELSDIEAMSVYVECEYHDTVEGASFIINNIELIAEAISKGICNYYGIEW